MVYKGICHRNFNDVEVSFREMQDATEELFIRICISVYVIRIRKDLRTLDSVKLLAQCVIGRDIERGENEGIVYNHLLRLSTMPECIGIINRVSTHFKLPIHDPIFACVKCGIALYYEFKLRLTRQRRTRIIKLRTMFCDLLWHGLNTDLPQRMYVETNFWVAYTDLYEMCVLEKSHRHFLPIKNKRMSE